MSVSTPTAAFYPTNKTVISLIEDFDDPQGKFNNYAAWDATAESNLQKQSHVDIRTFKQTDDTVTRQLSYFDTQTVGALDGIAMSDLESSVVLRKGEQWSAGTVGKQSDRNNQYGLSLSCSIGTNTTTSVILPPPAGILEADTKIVSINLLDGFADTDVISLALPAFPLSSINTATSSIDFTSATDGSFNIEAYDSIKFNQSTSTLASGNTELKFPRSLLTNTNLANITGIRLKVVATAACTFRILAIRLLKSTWQWPDIDVDTKQKALRPSVARDGSLRNRASFSGYTLPIVWHADVPAGVADPQVLNARIAVTFNTGELAFSSYSTPNKLSVYFRENTRDELVQSNLDLLTQASLDGNAQPDFGVNTYVGRTQTNLDLRTQGQLDGGGQTDLEHITNTLHGAYIRAGIQFGNGFTSVEIRNAIGTGYEIDSVGTLSPNSDYIFIAEIKDQSARVVIYPLTSTGLITNIPVIDTNYVHDSFLIKRRLGRIGWSAYLVDGDISVNSIQPMSVNYGEIRTKAFESITPVDRVQLYVEGSTTKEWFAGIDVGPWGGSTITPDRNVTFNSDESYKVILDGTTGLQGIQTNKFFIENFETIEASLDIRYPRSALDTVRPQAYLLGDNQRLIPLALNISNPDQWSHIHLYNFASGLIQPGYYRLIIIASSPNPVTFWVDNISIIERLISWSARANDSDPWNYTSAPWTPFKNLINDDYSGVILNHPGKFLRVRGMVHKQNAFIHSFKIKPRYAELGRFTWPEDTFTKNTLLTPVFNLSVSDHTVTADATNSSSTNTRIVHYVWNFGDDSGDNGPVVTHTFLGTGYNVYNVTLSLFDEYGNSASTTQRIGI